MTPSSQFSERSAFTLHELLLVILILILVVLLGSSVVARQRHTAQFTHWQNLSRGMRQDEHLRLYYTFDASDPYYLTNSAEAPEPDSNPFPSGPAASLPDGVDGEYRGDAMPIAGAGRWDHKSAAFFDGHYDFIALRRQISYPPPTQMTVACWFRSNIEQAQILLSLSRKQGWTLYRQSLHYPFAPGLYLKDTAGEESWILGTEMIKDENWHLVIAIYDMDTEHPYMAIYLDGKEVAKENLTQEQLFSSQKPDTLSFANIGVGASILEYGGEAHPDSWFAGEIDELSVWDRVLSMEEIRLLHDQGAP